MDCRVVASPGRRPMQEVVGSSPIAAPKMMDSDGICKYLSR